MMSLHQKMWRRGDMKTPKMTALDVALDKSTRLGLKLVSA
jgi:hypothetical protein